MLPRHVGHGFWGYRSCCVTRWTCGTVGGVDIGVWFGGVDDLLPDALLDALLDAVAQASHNSAPCLPPGPTDRPYRSPPGLPSIPCTSHPDAPPAHTFHSQTQTAGCPGHAPPLSTTHNTPRRVSPIWLVHGHRWRVYDRTERTSVGWHWGGKDVCRNEPLVRAFWQWLERIGVRRWRHRRGGRRWCSGWGGRRRGSVSIGWDGGGWCW